MKDIDLRPRVRALEIISAKLQQTVWLTRFTLGAVLTLALAGGAGIVSLSREVASVKQDVSWLVRIQKENRDDSATTGPRTEIRGATFEAAPADSLSTFPQSGTRGRIAGAASTKGPTDD